MTVITFPSVRSSHPHLRRFDPRRDLRPVADLIEVCFADTLDADGRRYIRQMRAAARQPHLLRWSAGLGERPYAPFSGFVWEQDGKIVGNLSQIPVPIRGGKIYLIANVAVHPAYRRRGIARSLTRAALEHSARRKAQSTWLHVRDDNPAAIALYRSTGFVERARRTTWKKDGPWHDMVFPHQGLQIVPYHRAHWPLHRQWLDHDYPPSLRWYLPLHVQALRPGLAGFLIRLFTGIDARQWAATWEGKLIAVLTWQRTRGSADRLWLAMAPDAGDSAYQHLIQHACQHIPVNRPLLLEHAASEEMGVHLSCLGFHPQHTLIWMEHRP